MKKLVDTSLTIYLADWSLALARTTLKGLDQRVGPLLTRSHTQFCSGSKSGDGVSTKTERESPSASGEMKYVGTTVE